MFRFLKTLIVTSVPFGLLMSLPYTFLAGSHVGFLIGMAAGLFSGLTIAAFEAWQHRRFTIRSHVLEGEQLIKQGPANHFRGWEAVGGWLYLTDTKLLFRPHRFNLQKHEWAIPLAKIGEIQPYPTGLVVPNGLRISTPQGPERFVIEDRRSWLEAIRAARD